MLAIEETVGENTIEEWRPGCQRQFISQFSGGCKVLVRSRVSNEGITPELWGPWLVWDRFPTEEEARHRHNLSVGIS